MAAEQYMIVRGKAEDVVKLVNNALADGWLPLGGPFVVIERALDVDARVVPMIAQALVCGDTAERLVRRSS